MEWNGVYIPLLPLDQYPLLQAPVPFVVGIPSTKDIPQSLIGAALYDDDADLVWLDLDQAREDGVIPRPDSAVRPRCVPPTAPAPHDRARHNANVVSRGCPWPRC